MIHRIVFLPILSLIILSIHPIHCYSYGQIVFRYTFTVSSNIMDIVYTLETIYMPSNNTYVISNRIVVHRVDLHVGLRGIGRDEFIEKVIGAITSKWVSLLSEQFDSAREYPIRYLSINGFIVKTIVVRRNNTIEYRDLKTGILLGGEAIYSISIGVKANGIRTIELGSFHIRYTVENIEPSTYINELTIINYPQKQYITILLIPAILLTALAIGTLSRWRYYVII